MVADPPAEPMLTMESPPAVAMVRTQFLRQRLFERMVHILDHQIDRFTRKAAHASIRQCLTHRL